MISCYSPRGLVEYLLAPKALSAECIHLMNTVSTDVSLPDMSHYFFILCLTALLEFPFYFVLLADKHKHFRNIALTTLLCNLATHPIVYLIVPYLGKHYGISYGNMLGIAEVFAPLTEILLMTMVFKNKKKSTWALIILGNIFSWGVGIYLV